MYSPNRPRHRPGGDPMDETDNTATPTPTVPDVNGDPGAEAAASNNLVVSEYYRKINAEWDELAAQHPAPTRDDVRPEWIWVRDHMADNSIDPEGKYWGMHVAVYNQKIVGADTEPGRLHVRVARELGVHPERMVVVYLGEI